MMATLKAEYRKILSIRSTWVLIVIAVLMAVGLIGFWIFGYKNVGRADTMVGADALQTYIFTAAGFVSILLSFIAALAVGHEYRYNTIMYSLTSANRRGKVYVSKLFAVLSFTLPVAAVVVACGIGAMYFGLHLAGVSMVGQQIDVWAVIWRTVAAVAGGIAYAYIITMLLRSMIGAIAVILLLPSTVEGILTLVLKENVHYLPYTALSNLTQSNPTNLTTSLLVVGAYVVVLGMVSYGLFLDRDAN